MINETQIRIQKEFRLVLNERAREENTLSTDLWKKTVRLLEHNLIKIK